MNDIADGAEKCPFFARKKSTHSIVCQGLCREVDSITLYFLKKAECATQYDLFCKDRYEKCEIFSAVKEARGDD